jgi:hypothetical protein
MPFSGFSASFASHFEHLFCREESIQPFLMTFLDACAKKCQALRKMQATTLHAEIVCR